jgi:NADH-quinone oxidoreductase subunit J
MDFLISHFTEIVFYVLASLAVLGAIGVVVLKSPVHSALSLLWTFLVVAGLFVLEHAEFLAAVQILVYGGGILVLFLFVIMMVNVKGIHPDHATLSRLAPAAVLAGVLLGAIMAIAILLGVTATGGAGSEALRMVEGQQMGNTQAVGWALYRTYLVPFEIVSVVLLVAMIGAIVFGRRDPSLEEPGGGLKP